MNPEEKIKGQSLADVVAENLYKGEDFVLGTFIRRRKDTGFSNHVVISDDLRSLPLFDRCLNNAIEGDAKIHQKWQLHCVRGAEGELDMEPGVINTMQHIASDNPAALADSRITNDIIESMFDALETLHDNDILQLCMCPSAVMMRKGSSQVLLPMHGSYFIPMGDIKQLFKGNEDYVAPEVLAGQTPDERSDVYAAGKFIDFIFSIAGPPYQYRKAIAKATQEDADSRYQTVADMRKAIKRMAASRRTLIDLAIAFVIALFLVGGYFSIVPDTNDVEFIKLRPDTYVDPDKKLADSLLDAMQRGDTAIITPAQQREMAEYHKKNLDIFRKRYKDRAQPILEKIYKKENLNAPAKRLIQGSSQSVGKLIDLQNELMGETGLSKQEADMIATEVILELSEKMEYQ